MPKVSFAVRIAVIGTAGLLFAGCGGGKSDASKSVPAASSASATGSASAGLSVTAGASGTAPSVAVGSLTAAQVVARAKAVALAAPDLHLSGAGADGAQSVGLDIAFGKAGSAGTVTVNRMPLTLLQRDGSTYFKATDAFWRAQAPTQAGKILSVIKGRWIKVSAGDSQFGDLAKLADRSALIDQFFTPGGTVTKGATVQQDGVQCLTLTSAKDGTLFVALDDARPILSKGATAADGQLKFAYSPVAIPPAPAASDVIDASALGAS